MKKISLYESLEVDSRRKSCILDGKQYKTLNGAWTFYVPKTQTKWFHSRAEKAVCLSEKAPQCPSEVSDSKDYGVYSSNDWISILNECIYTKAATNYVIIEKLSKHGLGPKALGFSIVKHTTSTDGKLNGISVGVDVENINKLRKKAKATAEDFEKIGVIPDRINSALRQQIRGYVSDLNSVICVRLQQHDPRINELAIMLKSTTPIL